MENLISLQENILLILHKARDTATLKALMLMIVLALPTALLPNPQKAVVVLQNPLKNINREINQTQNQEVLCIADI